MPINIDLSNIPSITKAKEKAKLEGKLEGELEKELEIAEAMLADGLPIAQISKFTTLPIKELEKLQKN